MAVSTTVQVTLPAMGESVTEGTVLEWHKAEGDHVEADETLVEISTDKVDAEVPSPVSGTVVKVYAADGDTVTVGAVLAEILPDGASGNGASGNGAASAAPPAAAEAPSDDGAGEVVDIVTPGAGESVTEGTLLEWHVEVGSSVADGDTIVEISTDKVDVELPAPSAGVITELLAAEGETVTVGQVIARMRVGAGQAPSAPAATPSAPAAATGAPAGAATPDGMKVSPVAARVAAAEGVNLAAVTGSGPGGRVTKADVLAAGDGSAASAATASPLRGGAAMLAKYMDESRSIPTATSFRTITVTQMDGRRKQLKDAGQKVSFTHLIAWAIAKAATDEMPVMAHHFEEQDGKPFRLDDGAVNLGIAVDVEKKDGSRTLMVPVIRDAGRLSFADFKAAFDALIDKARTNTLSADDLVGANISLTNPGGIGTVASVPRLMVGSGTIIATGSIAYPVGLGNVGVELGVEKVMSMTSTYDHRIIQGAESGRFLKTIEEYLQGEHGFYEAVFSSLGAALGPVVEPPKPQLTAAPAAAGAVSPQGDDLELMQAVQAGTALVKAFRTHGHLAARLDPLGSEPSGDPALDPDTVHLTPELMRRIPSKILRIYVEGSNLEEALPHLRETYTGSIAYEIEHIASHRQRLWLRERIEGGAFRARLEPEAQRRVLRRLIAVDGLERFLHKAYLGQKQFSIEGLDMTVPMLDEAIELSAAGGAREVVIGMAHRGRLSVLAHNLGRPYETIFGEFEGTSSISVIKAVTEIPQGGTGDVKYHHGYQRDYELRDGGTVLVNLESNPSHLEFVDPVVLGATRAAQTSRDGARAVRQPSAAVPIILHGDAAFPGQGVVAETLNLQALDGYQVGGALHLVQNNQVGFTTDFEDSRSTQWASDLAKGFDVPIIHVNADDVEASISAVRLAMAFRAEFGHDVLIDLIGYRRFGHNEADEPAYTQPEMYAQIKRHERAANLYATRLINDGVATKEEVDGWQQDIWDELTRLHQSLKVRIKEAQEAGSVEQPTGEYQLDRTPSPNVETAVAGRRPAQAQRRVADGARGLHDPSEARQAAREEARGRRRRGRHRLGAGRGARVRLTARRRCADPDDGPGHRARHVQPAAHGAARRQDRPDLLPDPAPRRCAGSDGAAQQPAVGDRVPGLRVRLLAGGARGPRAVGGAVRRLRQRRPGDHRPVHRERPGEVGPVLAADAAAAARLRGLRSRALARHGSSASSSSPPRATSASRT